MSRPILALALACIPLISAMAPEPRLPPVQRGYIQGKRSLVLFSGPYPIRMASSEDDGRSGTPLEKIGDLGGIVAMASVERLHDGDDMALFHDDGRFFRSEGKRTKFQVYKTISHDGGRTWGRPEVIAEHPDADRRETGLVRSPDGEQIAVPPRENRRGRASFVIFSDDEGKTWTSPRELPGSLTGDRHVGKYAPDGGPFISSRDTTRESLTRGDWVGWVRAHDDIARGREGQSRARLMDTRMADDRACPGVEVLPNGTLAATTYGRWADGRRPYVVSVRFSLAELDAMAKDGSEPRAATGSASTLSTERPRLVVLTDISSLTAGEAEPDDGQSLIRLMLYSNEFDIEGLVASSNLGHGQKVRPELIRQVVDAYGEARPNLLLHDDRYPPAERLRDGIKAGQPVAGPKVSVAESVGDGKDTEASDWIIRVVDRPDPRPVWVVVWGGSADLAQALWRIRATRSPKELDRFLSRLRVHSIGDQDSTGPWIRGEFPGLFTITQQRAFRGMYRGGDTTLVSSEWVRKNIHGHGPLGDLYPDYRGGDIWSSTLGQVRGIKEGDTPSFLSLAPNGLGDVERPSLGSWGGRFEGEGGRITDVPDTDLGSSKDPDPRMSSVYRWRPAFQADFAARLDWCLKPHAEANHPPIARIAGDRERTIKAGDVVSLDAADTTDPNGDELDFSWSVYPSSPELAGKVVMEGRDTKNPRIVISPELADETIPVLLTVTDRGEPKLTRYGRVLLKVGRAD